MPPQPPAARRIDTTIEQLGRLRHDEYAWMKDPNWQTVLRDPSTLRGDIRDHLVAENAYTAAILAPIDPLQVDILNEFRGRMRNDEWSVPQPDGEWEYYTRFAPGAQQPIFARRRVYALAHAPAPVGPGPDEQILVDAETLAQGFEFYRIAATGHSADHRLFAYAEDTQGAEVFRIRIKDLTTRETHEGIVENATGNFVFSPCGQFLFWTYRDHHGRPTRIYRRNLNTHIDALVYEEADPGFFLHVMTSESRQFIQIVCGDKSTSEVWLIPAQSPTADPSCVHPRETGLRYELTHWGEDFIIRTNADQAVDFKLMHTPQTTPGRAHWRDLRAHQAGQFVAHVKAFADYLAYTVRETVNNRIIILDRAGNSHEITAEEEAYLLEALGGGTYNAHILRYTYESPTTPRQWFDYDMRQRQRVLRKTQDIPSGHNPANYVTKRLFATAHDGARIPITVTMRHGTPLDGSAPLFLYGYGAYGLAIEPHFSFRALSLIDRGWIWAIAHVRGGSECGWQWFLDGRGTRKPNSFNDFIAVAEHLTHHGYGRAGQVMAHGASAGGMLMGAVANMRPDLFAGIIAGVPFVDVLNTMSDISLPLTPPEWPEWGNPLTSTTDYDLIESYSPYDQIAPQPYPAILATGGLSDPRVTYWEPAKWVARLRATTTSDTPIMLKMNMEAGHSGAPGRYEALREAALTYAFAIWTHQKAVTGKS